MTILRKTQKQSVLNRFKPLGHTRENVCVCKVRRSVVFTDHVLDGVPFQQLYVSASHRRCTFPFVRCSCQPRALSALSPPSTKVLQFLECLAHVFLPRVEPQRSVTNEDDNLNFVLTIPNFSESLIPFFAALIHTGMKPANSAGVPGHSWSKDDVGLNGCGCATPSHSTHLCCDWLKSDRIFTTVLPLVSFF